MSKGHSSPLIPASPRTGPRVRRRFQINEGRGRRKAGVNLGDFAAVVLGQLGKARWKVNKSKEVKKKSEEDEKAKGSK